MLLFFFLVSLDNSSKMDGRLLPGNWGASADTVFALVTGGKSRAILVCVSLFSRSLRPTIFEWVLVCSMRSLSFCRRYFSTNPGCQAMSCVEVALLLATLATLGEWLCSLGL